MSGHVYQRPACLAAAAVLLVTSVATSCKPRGREAPGADSGLTIGVKIYKNENDPAGLIRTWKKLGINTVFVGLETAKGGDLVAAARRAGIKTFIIVPAFYNPEKLAAAPGLYAVTGEGRPAKDDWVEFVCPGQADYRREFVEKVKKLVAELDPDGISLDFIRHFVFWEKVHPGASLDPLKTTCFCQDCLEGFEKASGVAIPDEVKGYPQVARWILDNHEAAWTAWRCGQVTSFVKEVAVGLRQVKPYALLNVHLVPWREEDFGGARTRVAAQDVAAMARYADTLSPMCYAHMLKRNPEWISSVTADLRRAAPNPILTSIQVQEAYLPEKLGLDEFELSLLEALKPPSQGVVFWNWEALAASPEKQAVVEKHVRRLTAAAAERTREAPAPAPARAGLRASPYGPRGPVPDAAYWTRSAKSMAERFPGSSPSFIWIVSTMERDPSKPSGRSFTSRTRLTFPAPESGAGSFENMIFADEDVNEPYLEAFDRAGCKVWLQVEPAMADVPALINLVMDRYGRHPCVIGFGIDVEWYRWSERDNEGVAVTDEQARAWSKLLRSRDSGYLLFLKHWEQSQLPPTYRQGVVFVDDSQIFRSLEELRLEFSRWARWFNPAPVAFQFGYPSDRPWWKKLPDPPADIGRAVLGAAANISDLYWVDFTVREIWPQ